MRCNNRRRVALVAPALVISSVLFGWFQVPNAAANMYNPPYADIFGSQWSDIDTRPAAHNFYTSLSSNYNKFLTYNTDVWTAMGTYFAQSDAIWVNFGHGAPGFITWCKPGRTGGCSTVLRTNFDCSYTDGTCLSNYPSSIHHIRLMIFAGCRTAQGTNMASYAYSFNGVDSSIAFWDYLQVGGLLPADRYWAQQFPLYINQHYTVGQAATLAAQDVVNYRWPFGGDGWDTQRVFGSGIYTEPAAYGS
jgi:hypothetical protein